MKLAPRVGWRPFLSDLYKAINDDNVFNGAAALGFYLTLAIFPAMIFILSIVPYLPIHNVDQAIWGALLQIMPEQSAQMFKGTILDITQNRKAGLLSASIIGTLWAAMNGTYAIMQQLDFTYDVKDERSFVKIRLVALGLTLLLGTLFVVAFGLVVAGGDIQSWVVGKLGNSGWIHVCFGIIRWIIILAAMLLAFALTYYFGPDVEQKFKFITPGSILGTVLLIAASLGFRAYVDNFGNYNATYGSIGAVIVMMFWLYIAGLVILFGSEVNSLLEDYSPQGKSRGEKKEKDAA